MLFVYKVTNTSDELNVYYPEQVVYLGLRSGTVVSSVPSAQLETLEKYTRGHHNTQK